MNLTHCTHKGFCSSVSSVRFQKFKTCAAVVGILFTTAILLASCLQLLRLKGWNFRLEDREVFVRKCITNGTYHQLKDSWAGPLPLKKICTELEDCLDGNNFLHSTEIEGSKRNSKLRRERRKSGKFVNGIEQLEMRDFRMEISYPKETPKIHFIVYKSTSPARALSSKKIKFSKTAKVAFYIHGFATTDLKDGLNIKNALLNDSGDVEFVVIVDWRKYATSNVTNNSTAVEDYKNVALTNAPLVAERLKNFMLEKLREDNYVYLIGFSLGGHIAGTAARKAAASPGGFIVDRITGLDPAGPIFEYSLYFLFPIDSTNTIRPSDAKLVDIIHVCENLGMNNPAGHLDIYITENKCKEDSTCQHHTAVDVFIASLTTCSLITCPRNEECTHKTISSCGYLADKYEGRGVHNLSLTVTNPKIWKDRRCSEFMNVYLPAKHRICVGKDSCVGMPYLSECKMECKRKAKVGVCSVSPEIKMGQKQRAIKLRIIKKRNEDVGKFVDWQCPFKGKGRL